VGPHFKICRRQDGNRSCAEGEDLPGVGHCKSPELLTASQTDSPVWRCDSQHETYLSELQMRVIFDLARASPPARRGVRTPIQATIVFPPSRLSRSRQHAIPPAPAKAAFVRTLDIFCVSQALRSRRSDCRSVGVRTRESFASRSLRVLFWP
jgi:hypothetical protein